MRTIAIIQARMGSTRFPGKVKAMLAGKTVLQRVIERTKRLHVDEVVVATTCKMEDRALVDPPRDGVIGIWWAGDPNDVLGRYVAVARDQGADRIVRITADCPLLDPDIGNRVIDALSPDIDYASNVIRRTCPKGWDVEAMWIDTLMRLDRMTTDPRDREHVTTLIRDNLASNGLNLWAACNVEGRPDRSFLNYCVDYPEDITRLERDARELLD